MPTIFTHPAVPIAVAIGLGSGLISGRLLAAGIAASIAPDLDVLSFHFGVGGWSAFGHRGLTHSLAAAAIMGLAAMAASGALHTTRVRAFVFVTLAAASHGLLDMLTDGGSGVALFWPFAGDRLFWPVQPVEVSPISLRRFFSARGAEVIASELRWVWAPALVLAAACAAARRSAARGVRG
jgi:inner membrane protein